MLLGRTSHTEGAGRLRAKAVLSPAPPGSLPPQLPGQSSHRARRSSLLDSENPKGPSRPSSLIHARVSPPNPPHQGTTQQPPTRAPWPTVAREGGREGGEGRPTAGPLPAHHWLQLSRRKISPGRRCSWSKKQWHWLAFTQPPSCRKRPGGQRQPAGPKAGGVMPGNKRLQRRAPRGEPKGGPGSPSTQLLWQLLLTPSCRHVCGQGSTRPRSQCPACTKTMSGPQSAEKRDGAGRRNGRADHRTGEPGSLPSLLPLGLQDCISHRSQPCANPMERGRVGLSLVDGAQEPSLLPRRENARKTFCWLFHLNPPNCPPPPAMSFLWKDKERQECQQGRVKKVKMVAVTA